MTWAWIASPSITWTRARRSSLPTTPPFYEALPGSGPRSFAFHPSGRVGLLPQRDSQHTRRPGLGWRARDSDQNPEHLDPPRRLYRIEYRGHGRGRFCRPVRICLQSRGQQRGGFLHRRSPGNAQSGAACGLWRQDPSPFRPRSRQSVAAGGQPGLLQYRRLCAQHAIWTSDSNRQSIPAELPRLPCLPLREKNTPLPLLVPG